MTAKRVTPKGPDTRFNTTCRTCGLWIFQTASGAWAHDKLADHPADPGDHPAEETTADAR